MARVALYSSSKSSDSREFIYKLLEYSTYVFKKKNTELFN